MILRIIETYFNSKIFLRIIIHKLFNLTIKSYAMITKWNSMNFMNEDVSIIQRMLFVLIIVIGLVNNY